jgi:antitoxin component YwqK of YwqJK toxin-antitoxin module
MSVPIDARWVAADEEWEQGDIDAAGLKQGPFTYWRADGTKCNECVLKDGTPHGPFRRFHQNGETSQEGTFVDGAPHGTRRWLACDEPTTERMHEGGVSLKVRRSEMDYERGRVVGIRHFDAQGRRVSPHGEPYPERPAAVAEAAEYRPDDEVWTLGEANSQTAARMGRWRTWAAEGRLLEDAVYEEGSLHGPVKTWVGEPNPFLNEAIAWESGRCEHGVRVGPWEFLDEAGAVHATVDYGIASQLEVPHLAAWSNEARTDWEEQGRALLARHEVRAALVTLARACAVAKSTRPLAAVLEGRVRALKPEAAEAFAEQCDAELPALATGLLDGCSVAHVLRRLAVALDQAHQSRAALDFVNAALLFAPEETTFLFTRALVLMSLGLGEQAARDATDLASASPEQAEFLLDYGRLLFPRFDFWPTRDQPLSTHEAQPEVPVKSLADIAALVRKYATRLSATRAAVLHFVTDAAPFMVPDLSALLPDGPVPLETGELEVPSDDGEALRTVTFDETLELGGLDLPSLMRLARADWAGLTWLLWATGQKHVAVPTALNPPKAFGVAAHSSSQRLWRARDQHLFEGRNARAQQVPSFEWEGADVGDLSPTLASIAEQQYAEMQALFYWLAKPSVRSPWQDNLRGS